MSFPKARILRFNEEMTCAPPPGKYDPKYDSKVKGAVIEKSKRFTDGQLELAGSFETLDTLSSCTLPNSRASFRTPQLSRVPKSRTSRFNEEMASVPPTKHDSKVKGADNEKSKRFANGNLKLTSSFETLDSISCCSLTTKASFRTPQPVRVLFEEKCPGQSELKIEIKCLQDKLAQTLKSLTLKDVKSFENERQIEELAAQLEQCIRNKSQISREKEEEIKQLKEDNVVIDNQMKELHAELSENKLIIEEIQATVLKLKADLQMKDQDNILLKEDLEMSKISAIKISDEYDLMLGMYNEEVDKHKILLNSHQESQKYIQQLIEENRMGNNNRSIEIDLLNNKIKELSEENVKLQNFITELKRQHLDFKENAKQQDMERTLFFNGEIQKLNENIHFYKGQITSLEDQLTKIQSSKEDLRESVENLVVEEIKLKEELNSMKKIKGSFENEVLQLTHQNKELKAENSSFNSKFEEMKEEKNDLVEMIKRQMEEIDLLKNEVKNKQTNIDELKQTEIQRFEQIKSNHQKEMQSHILSLEQKLDHSDKLASQLKSREQDLLFKIKAAETDLNLAEVEREKYLSDNKKLENTIVDLENTLSQYNKRKVEYKLCIESLEQENRDFVQKIETMYEENEKLADKAHNESKMVDDSKNLVEELYARISDLEARNQELESIIGPFKEQLVQFERERTSILERTENTEKELKMMVLEQAKFLGHQNHRQKIKHVVHLTETICDLKKQLLKLRNENNQLRADMLEHRLKENTLRRTLSLRNRKENKENGSCSNREERITNCPSHPIQQSDQQ